MGCGHTGLRHLSAAVHVLVDVVGVGWRWLLATRWTVVEVGFVVQRWRTITMLLRRLLLRVTLTWELSREALLRIPHHTVRSGWGGFL